MKSKAALMSITMIVIMKLNLITKISNATDRSIMIIAKVLWGNLYDESSLYTKQMWSCDQSGIKDTLELNWSNILQPGNKTKTNNNQKCTLCCNFSISISVMLVIYLVTNSFSTQHQVLDTNFFQYLYNVIVHFFGWWQIG